MDGNNNDASAAATTASATIVALPPKPPPPSSATTMPGMGATTGAAAAMPLFQDPQALLDSYDRQTRKASASGAAATVVVDPVQFLNRHYQTEAALTQHLAPLRAAIDARMGTLDERMATALARQSDTAASSREAVQHARAAIATLSDRIAWVQQKAAQSEQAVLHITSDMKQLDTSKRHLQRTITTLKRLHMLVHAVEELRLLNNSGSSSSQQAPDFKAASQLVQAIRILFSHLDSFTKTNSSAVQQQQHAKVPPLAKLGQTVEWLQSDLQKQAVQGFRRAALGGEAARLVELEELQAEKKKKRQQAQAQKNKKGKKGGDASDVVIPDETADEEELPTSALFVMTPEVMRGSVLYLDALGMTVRTDFVRHFCRDLLRPYVKDFAPEKEGAASSHNKKPATPAPEPPPKRVSSFLASPAPAPEPPEPEPEAPPPPVKKCFLDSVEHRFLWFRQVLEDEVQPTFGSIFPADWNVQATLARAFLQTTLQHYRVLLSAKGGRRRADAQNATVLLHALQKTLVFEKEITAWLIRECQTEFSSGSNTTDKPKKADDDEEEEEGANKSSSNSKTVPVEPLLGVASIAFDNCMAPYIKLEEEEMQKLLGPAALQDRTVDNRGALPVYISSTNLFVYIKGSIARCTALTKQKPFFQLYQAFSHALRRYAQLLQQKLPKSTQADSSATTAPGATAAALAGISTIAKSTLGGTTSAATTEGHHHNNPAAESYKIPSGEEVTVCHVISTCEYCTDTVEALEELIRDTAVPPYQAKISMMADQEAFSELTAQALRVLVSGLTNRCQEVALKQLSSTDWGRWEAVGEESDYVRLLHQEIQPFGVTCKSLLPQSYFRSFCDKFAATFTNLYHDTLVRLKRINEPATQQLLLDVYSLKTLFLKLPVLSVEDGKNNNNLGRSPAAAASSTIAPAMYTKLVQKQFGRIETLLKLVGTPVDLLIDNFKSMTAGSNPANAAAELQVVMNLKGIKRPDQVTLLEQFGLDPRKALKGATMGISSTSIVTERVQAVTSDLNQITRQKVDDFRKSFR